MRVIGLGLSVAVLIACQSQESPAQQKMTRPGAERHDTALAPQFALHSTLGGKLRAPEGLEVDYFARNTGSVRFMVLGPDGAVYASRPGEGDILRLADTNGDGTADDVSTVISGLNRPHGMAFLRDSFYVAEGSQLTAFPLDANHRPGGARRRVATYSGGGGHWTRTVIVGPDSLLYVSVGSSCNICEGDTPQRAAVLQAQRSGMTRPYSIGLRNAVGLAVNPATREIWVTTHERDNLGDDVPPEEIDILKDGADYGWPYCWGDREPNPEYKNAARCAQTTPPALMMQAHSAPLGIAFLRGATQLRSEYQGDALVAFHGSWNRSVPTGAKVVRVRIADGKPVSYEDFVTGWQDASGDRWGRPVGVLVNRDGSVLISDDSGNAIYRVHR
ncbi:MAG: sorbosone dehydrogenase family protein [Gemmatimonadaceae bacterium]|nr:sorbosone dehydrogenase family protein [Gemmatimonadaceae bacterium]NUQ92174.1 sorbosone dehydrogenase family protein [Gemmatimonadaceae bacterium]NUR20955.1 sorbosone dehydrogenase family protein [Gemmatimonadaceae bacterium]NUS96770.1 sorbosone dehydrogenase family protein [Gemmatimonadaceae bacterium]